MLGTVITQLGQLIAADPGSATLCGDILKFATAPYRAGRALDNSIDDYVERIKTRGDQPQRDDPTTQQNKIALQIEQMKLAYAKTKDDADRQVKVMQFQAQNQGKIQDNQIDAQAKQMEVQGRQQENNAKIVQIQQDGLNKQREHEFKLREAATKAVRHGASGQHAAGCDEGAANHTTDGGSPRPAAVQGDTDTAARRRRPI